MKIAIVTRCDVPFCLDSAHADWSSDYQVSRLLALRGHEIRLYARHQGLIEIVDNGITHVDTGDGKIRTIADLLLAGDSDVIIISSWKSLARELVSAKASRPIVLHIRANKDLNALDPISLESDVNSFIAVSATLGTALAERGYPPTKIHVIENGYSPEIFAPYFGEREASLVYAGAIVTEKGIGLLLEAFREISGRDTRQHLHLYGSSRLYGHSSEYQFERTTLEDPNVHIHGLCRQRELAHAFQRAELGFLLTDPSAGFETFGKTALEMQVCGLPVVVSSNGALPERVVDGKTGYILHSYTAQELCRIIRHHLTKGAEERLAMSHAAYENSRSLTWERSANRLHDLICSLLPPPKPHTR